MFHTILTVSYIIPNIYVFARIWQLFIIKRYRLQYVFIYALLVSVYPLSNLLEDNSSGFLINSLTNIADYLLPFWLYLFLSVLVFDLFLLLNLFLKIISSSRFKTDRFKSSGLIVMIVFPVIVVIAGIINFNTIRTSTYKVEIPAGSSKLTQLRIAFVSDAHFNEETGIDFVERFAAKIVEINPDILLFGGDIVEGRRNDGNLEQIHNILREIKPRFGSFGVLGNHEYYARQDKGDFFDNAGISLLVDTILVIDSSFTLAGRNDSRYNARKSIYELLRNAADTLPVILVDHRPTDIDNVSKTMVNIQLSGHTHHGQLFPINLITGNVYELSFGYMEKGDTHFYVSSGLRLWGPPVRTTGKSEIIVLEITLT